MTTYPTDLWYHAEVPLLRAPTVWVELPDGRPYARFHRRDDGETPLRWCWTGGGLDDFALEMQGPGESFLVTDPHGAPFGRIDQQGRLLPRLVATDARRDRFSIELDGRIQTVARARHRLGTLDLRRLGDLRAQLPTASDDTVRVLLVAAPLCHVAHALSMQMV